MSKQDRIVSELMHMVSSVVENRYGSGDDLDQDALVEDLGEINTAIENILDE